jgi:isopropylmalate/homocitrate/citramalate synthase
MTFANAAAAAENGARCIDASILGIGERTGLAPLEKVLALIKSDPQGRQGWGRCPEILAEAVALVERSIDYSHFAQRSFAHKSGIHINGVLKDPTSYEPVEPASRGGRRLLVLSKLIGRSGLRTISSRCGFAFDDKELEEVLERVKSDEFLETADEREITLYLQHRGSTRAA